MLVTNITKAIALPHEPNESITIRKLSQTQLREAAKAKQTEGLGLMKDIGAELLRALREGDSGAAKKIEDAAAANVNSYDRDSLLRDGISAWSYQAPVTAETIGQLDEETAAYVADQVFEFARRRTEAERKNG